MAIETTQTHRLSNGSEIEITRQDSGRGHKYIVDGAYGNQMSSVTAMLGHVESNMFSVGSGWATKQIRLADGDITAPKRVGDKAIEDGNAIHDCIERYINTGEIAEDNPAFISWFNTVGQKHTWLAAETFLYHPGLSYGGTLDAISDGPILWDWKTKDPESYWKYGGSLKDHAQVASYANALLTMDSDYAPIRYARIAYIMRDGSGTDVIDVDLDAGSRLFKHSHDLYRMTAVYKEMTKPGHHE